MEGKKILKIVEQEAKKKGLSRYMIAKNGGFSQIQVKRWFDGDTSPSVSNFIKICQAVGLEIEIKATE